MPRLDCGVTASRGASIDHWGRHRSPGELGGGQCSVLSLFSGSSVSVKTHSREAAAATAGRIRFCTSIFGAGRRFDLVATRANGQPAFGAYLRSPHEISRGSGLYVLTVVGDRIRAMTRFDNSALPWFGLPRSLPSR